MLKALIQLFAEKFLQSKYPDIAYQCGPSSTYQAQTVAAGGEKSYTAPFSGWAVLKIGNGEANQNTWFRLQNYSRGVAYLSTANCVWKWAAIPIQKGDNIVCDLGAYSGTGELTFVRNESSK